MKRTVHHNLRSAFAPAAVLMCGLVAMGCPVEDEENPQTGTTDSSTTDASTSGGSSTSDGPGSDTDATDTDSVGPTSDTDATDTDSGSTGGDTEVMWTSYAHSCPGPNRTDALHRDDDGTLWVGCGTAAAGYGLHSSDDGGATWSEVTVDDPTRMDEFRVSSISRGHDGALYVAGINASTSDMVLRLDTDAAPFALEATLVAGNQVGTSFHVGTYRELSDGRALAESLNGTDMLFRPDSMTGSDALTWTDTSGWFGGASAQILDLVVHDDAFYGVGSTIAEPPRLFLPPTGGTAEPYEFITLEMPHPDGEMWGVAASADYVVAVGMNQTDNIGRVYVSGADPYSVDDYTAHSLHDLIGVDASTVTWARGVCMQDDQIVVVGERQPLSTNTGIVVLSEDGGQTFEDITPDDVPTTVSKCLFEPDGTLIVAGADGYIGIRG